MLGVRTEDGHTAIGESGFEFVQDGISHRLGTLTYLEDGDNFGFGFGGGPDPHFRTAALHVTPQLIQLDMIQEQIAEETVMQLAPMLTTAS